MSWNLTIFDGAEAYEWISDGWRMVAVSAYGPRIAYLGKEQGDNLLYWDTAPGAERGEWKLRGGHRVWLTRPQADESEDTYVSDNAPCAVQRDGNILTLTAPPHPTHHLERGMRITALGGGRFIVANFIKNAGSMIYSGGVWSPTCIDPRGKVLRIPLGTEASWDVVHLVIPRVFAGNHTQLEDPQVTFEKNDLVARSQGHVMKRCAFSPRGIVQMEWPDRGITLRKKVDCVPFASYPLGCNVGIFIGEDNWMGEIETFGQEQPILPGETIYNTEEWSIIT